MPRLHALLCAGVLSIGAVGCDENLSSIAGPTPNLEPTFASIQKEIFNTQDSTGRLACVQCHSNLGRTPAAGLNLIDGVSYQSLVGVPSGAKPGAIRVVPGNPEASYLLNKLVGSPDIVGTRMPRSAGPYLTDGQIRIIRRWIELGAKND